MKLIGTPHPDDLAAVRTWFDRLSAHCRAIDYEGARPIFAEDMIAFGTFTDFMKTRELAEQKQWRNVWGTIRNFRYDLDKVEAIVSPDRLMATGMAVRTSTPDEMGALMASESAKVSSLVERLNLKQ